MEKTQESGSKTQVTEYLNLATKEFTKKVNMNMLGSCVLPHTVNSHKLIIDSAKVEQFWMRPLVLVLK